MHNVALDVALNVNYESFRTTLLFVSKNVYHFQSSVQILL